MAATLRGLADRLGGEYAYLIGRWPTEAVLVPVAPVLHYAADTLEPNRSDVLLAADGGATGLCLGYDHPPNAYEYSLLSWGRFVVDLGG